MRRGLLTLALAALTAAPLSAAAEITSARYTAPTTRYAHAVLGDAIEYGALELTHADGSTTLTTLPEVRVFEDLAPRLADLDGDGAPEVITVESHARRGARLAIHGSDGLIAATPYIGRAFRWLAPLGAADLDGDGHMELAYVDRPHLAKTLRIWRWQDGTLHEVAQMPGVTNHRIGDAVIWGGIRDCGAGPEMVLADSGFQSLSLVRFDGAALHRQDTDRPASQAGFDRAMACRD